MSTRKRTGTKRESAVGYSDDSTIASLTAELAKIKANLEQLQRRAATIEGLEQERDMLHLLLDHSKDAIYFKDLKSRYLRISRGHPALQYIDAPEKGIGKTDFDFFPIEHAQQAFDDEMRIIATGEPILGIIERETAPDMPEKWVFTSKLPMRDKNGETVGTFGISRDITQIKQYENELRRARDELEKRVRVRTEDLQSANKDLQRRIAQLNFLTSVSYEMAQCAGIQELAAVIIKAFSARLKQSASSLCITSHGKLSCIDTDGLLGREGCKEASEQAIPLLQADTLTHPTIVGNWADLLPRSAPWTDLQHLPFYVAIPLLADNQLIGIVQLFADKGTDRRFLEEEQVILTLAAHAAVSLSNALHYKELGDKAQLQGELEAARNIQQRLTPRFKPSIPRVNLKGLYSPAYEVGGDYLDYFKNEAGCWIVVIADVCGKGIPAALLMTMLRSAFRVEASRETSAKQLLCAVNNAMKINLDDRSFVTAICLIISSDGTCMSYARAGHPRLIRISAGDNRVETFESDGVALGILPENELFAQTIDELTIPLNNGDRFFIYTDGLTEAFNPQKNPYTTRRLLKLLESNIGTSPASMLNAIIRDIKVFTQGAPYHDDLTMIAMEVEPDGQV
ncbi:MAG: SpoIIE family protein phosphatase [Chitinispirillaceae bacterium]|nr:SpoIIE family protein phosphatase [Chitinispirillaceae bacterium]